MDMVSLEAFISGSSIVAEMCHCPPESMELKAHRHGAVTLWTGLQCTWGECALSSAVVQVFENTMAFVHHIDRFVPRTMHFRQYLVCAAWSVWHHVNSI